MIEHEEKLHNMKEYSCGVIQLCTPDFMPIEDKLAYCLLFASLNTVQHWVATGETNQDGIFHCHCLLQSGSRPDSLRRSISTVWEKLQRATGFTEGWGQECECQILKMQRCHKPSSLFGYILKNPLWIISSNEQLLQMAYDIDQWGRNERFKTPRGQETDPDMNEMSKAFVTIIQEGNCKTLEDMIKHDPGTMSRFLHRPGLAQIVQNCISFVKATAGQIDLSFYAKHEPQPAAIHAVLLFQGIKPSQFDITFYKWFTKTELKRNTILLYGPSNTGKSQFLSGLKQCMPWGEIVNGPTFNYEGLIDQPWGCYEEPLISPEGAEKWKQISEGMPTMISVKYKKPVLLPRTPIFMTSNHYPWRFCTAEEPMMRNRMTIFDFKYEAKDQPYISRTSEPSCECGPCRESRGSQTTDGSTGSSRSEQHTHKLDRGIDKPTTEHLDDPGEGPSTGCTVTSSTEVRVNTGQRSRVSTVSRTHGHVDREHNRPSNRRTGISPEHAGHVESKRHRGNNDPDSRTDGNNNTSRRGRAKKDLVESMLRPTMGLLCRDPTKKKEIQTTDTRTMDRTMAPITLSIPTPQDWKNYLSYLYHIYHDA